MRVLLLLLILSISCSADWRSDAMARIDQHRKADLQITLQNDSGTPIENASINITLKKHSFPFGAVIRSTQLYSTPYSDIYKENYKKYFNAAGASLGLKPKWWGTSTEESVDTAYQWFKANDFQYRGHAFVWEGEGFLPPDQVTIYNSSTLSDEEKADTLMKLMEAYMDHAMERWDVSCWDVVNEPVVNSIVNDLLPDLNTFSHWFNKADSLRTVHNREDIKLVLNENQIISNNAKWVVGKIDTFMTIIDSMVAKEAPLEMLGFQSRIKYGMLSPDTMYQRLVNFEKYNIPYQATEFEIRNSKNYTYTDAEVKQLTEEFMLTYFSHPKVEGIWHWTFVEKEAGTEKYALFNYDGTPRPTGEKWIELMEGLLNTDTTVTTNSEGSSSARAFLGTYEITITLDDTTVTKQIELKENSNLIFTITDGAESILISNKQQNGSPYTLSEKYLTFHTSQSKSYDLSIYSARGQQLHRVTDNKSVISLSEMGLAQGIYQMLITLDDKQFSEKVLIQ